jgi:tetratricopeptide (TPR) repeat protein
VSLARDPSNTQALALSVHLALVHAHGARSRRARRRWAREAVDRAKQLGPMRHASPGLAYLVSRAYAASGRWNEASVAAREAAQISPDGVWGPLARAELARDRRRRREARRHVADALRVAPDDPHVQRVGASLARDRLSRVRHLRAAGRGGDREAAEGASTLLVHISRPQAAVWPTILLALGLDLLCDLTGGPWWLYVALLVAAWLGLRAVALRLRQRALAELSPSGRALVLRTAGGGARGAVVACLIAAAIAFGGGWPLTEGSIVTLAEQRANREAARRDPVPVVVENEPGNVVVRLRRVRPAPDLDRAYQIKAYLVGAGMVLVIVAGTVLWDARRLRAAEPSGS